MRETRFKDTEIGRIPEDWDIVTLSSLCSSINSGKNVRRYSTGNYVVYGSTGIIGFSDIYVYNFQALLIARVGANAGTIHIVSGKYDVSDNTLIVHPIDSVNIDYIYRALIHQDLHKLIFGSGQPLITSTQLKSVLLPYPSNAIEQSRIASALTSIDNLISSLDRLIEKKKNIKQATMQQLLTGRKRLKGFTEPWVKTILKDLVSIGHGRDYKGLKEGPVPVFGTGGYMTSVSECLYDGPTVCIGRKGTIDKPQYHEGPIWTVDTLFFLHSFNGVIPKFLYYLFHTIDWLAMNEATGVPSLTANNIERIEVFLPSMEEQMAITSVLTTMDNEISKLESKKSKYESIKQGMMQQLLTGKIRLI